LITSKKNSSSNGGLVRPDALQGEAGLRITTIPLLVLLALIRLKLIISKKKEGKTKIG
jgi:hypothetical protein